MSWYRKLLLNGLAVLASLVVVVLAIEVFLRIDDRRPAARYEKVTIGGHDHWLFDDPAKLAELGEAIVFLGDSFTEGSACGREGNYPARFGELAQKAGVADQAVNLAVIDTNSYAYLTLAEDLLGTPPPPKGVVVTLFLNDIEPNCALCPHLAAIEASGALADDELAAVAELCAACTGGAADATAHYGPLRQLHRLLYTWSYAYRLLRESVYVIGPSLGLQVGWGAAYPEQWRDHDGLEFKLLELSVELLGQRFEAAGVPLLVVLYPPARMLRADNPTIGLYEAAARQLTARSGVPSLSGYPAFLDRPDRVENMGFSITDGHPNCKAHDLFAHWVFETYVDRLPAGAEQSARAH